MPCGEEVTMYYRKIAVVILSVVTCFELAGCGGNGGSGNIAPIRDKVAVQPFETLSSSQRTIELKCVAAEFGSPCESVVTSVSHSGNSYTVNFSGIYVSPNPCVAIVVPVIATVSLGNLGPGNYKLNFIVNGVWNTLGLAVSNTSIVLSGSDTSWVNYTNPVLTRVPSNTLWGWVSYGGTGMDTVVSSLLDSLKMAGAAPTTLADGYYYYFAVKSGRIVSTYPFATPMASTVYFAYSYSGPFAAVSKIANRHLLKYPSTMFMNIYDADGNRFPGVLETVSS